MKQVLRLILFFFIFFSVSHSLKAQIDGLLYSMTYGGGNNSNSNGVVNQFNPLTNYDTAVVNFNIANGAEGYGNFIQLKNGLLYGMTSQIRNGGNSNIFQYNVQTGKDSILYILPANGDSGQYIFGSLCLATNDTLYGLAYYGGTLYQQGLLFSFNYHTGAYRVLIQLRGRTMGSEPTGNPIQASNGLLYCLTTNSPGLNGYGTIFDYNISTKDTILCHNFTGAPNDGNYPRGTLLQVNDSMLYGLTIYGGLSDSGTLFSFNIHTNIETVLVNFNKSKGAYPYESLMQANDGNLYGTTIYGGVHDSGTLFRYNIASNTETVLHSFGGSDSGGYYPQSDVIQSSDGLLYGNTNGNTNLGGLNNMGTIFSYDISTNTEKNLYYYNFTNGAYPYGDFLEAMSASVSVVNNSCPNDSTGSLTMHVRGDRPPLTYSWSTGATTSSITNLKSGIYHDTVWDSRGIAFSFIDTVKPLPMVLTFDVSNSCYNMNDGSASVNVYGGIGPFTYKWSNGETNDTALNLANGTYTCAITDANGCPAINTVVITQAARLIIDSIVATKQTYPYNNGTVKVYVKGGIPPGDTACYLYVWSNGGPDSSVIRNLDSGTYSVCVTSCYGCGSTCYDSAKVLTGTKDLPNPDNLAKVYPVPSTGLVTLALMDNGFENLEITDVLGRSVYKAPLFPQLRNNTLHIDLGTQPDGAYIMYISSEQGVLTKKIIIQK